MRKIHFILAAVLMFVLAACKEENPVETPLATPENILCSEVTSSSLTFVWDKVDGAQRYAVRLTLASNGSSVTTEYSTTNSHTFTGLTSGTSYICQVRAIDGDRFSDFGSSAAYTPGSSEPDPVPDPEPEPEPEPEPDPTPDPEPTGNYAMLKIPASEDAHGKTLAFPGAEGGGMYVTGGRGGRIIHVTNLNDSGTGSLRAAVNQSGARIIVFDVAGVINLTSPLEIKNGNLTIAGQTAPGDGICVAGRTTVVKADNVIIRFMRFRLGDLLMNNMSDGDDCIWGRRQEGIILDHCSMSWSIDECASFYGNENFTMQWCLLTESLRASGHSKGNHGYGGIWGGMNASFHHNMLANHDSRNPRFDHPNVYENPSDPARRGNVDYRNNVVFNWGNNNTYGGEGAWFNIVNNYYKKGEASTDRKYIYDVNGVYTSNGTDYGYPDLYVSGNVYYDYPSITADNLTGLYWHDHGIYTVPSTATILSTPLSITPSGETAYTTTHSAEGAFNAVCDWAGASLVRDVVDARAVNDAKSGKATYSSGGNGSTGGIIDTQKAVGGWPTYSETTTNEANDKTDSDGDGMPDWFETLFGLDNSSNDASAYTIDSQYKRYSNFELYLHYLVRDVVAGQVAGGTYTEMN